ncbi:MAG: hypothetical protein JWR60_714, partial [Polaromonas sp.]|nr:hypothetical protein [Polaromonas sp.]
PDSTDNWGWLKYNLPLPSAKTTAPKRTISMPS